MSEDFSIRKAEPEDVSQVVDLAVEMVIHSVSPLREIDEETVRTYRRNDLRSLHRALARPHVGIFIAEVGARVVGHVIVFTAQQDSSTGETQGWIFDLAVSQDMWGRGVAQALMEHAETFSREAGVARLGLGVTISNQRALDFYHQQGYLEERVQMVKKL
ncbi:MAG: GNAT family N-acetyltransferase [Candidatus Eremiobacteraeota bacterium]|nr:GNAT family N-acetyltransferase [Candidatus Eremiobacteraeota bacterium]